MDLKVELISEEELRPGDARGRLATIRKLAAMNNALYNAQIRHDTGRENVGFSDSNFIFEYLQGAGDATAAPVTYQPFQIVDASGETAAIRVVASTIADALPTGFSLGDNPPYVQAVSGSGAVWATVTISSATAPALPNVATRQIVVTDGSVPSVDATLGSFVQIGSFSVANGVVSVSNDRYGPLGIEIYGGWNTPWTVRLG